MTKYKIKLRRNSLTHGQIQRHKNFSSLYSATAKEKKTYPLLRLVAILIAVALLVSMISLGVYRVIENKKEIDRQKSDTEFIDEI